LLRLGQLREALEEAELADSIPVITDGLPPTEAHRTWLSLFTPEAAAGGVIGRLRNGDALRIDLEEGLIRTGMKAGELERRESYELPNHPGKGYAGRYASSALPALEGAGFG
jgi:dihydroxyacid dehydratase/phosphogluconate dehydratase